MPGWIALTKQSLFDTKAAVLINTADTVLLGEGQTDRVSGVIADVTAEIRRKVARANALDADTTKIPAGLKSLAVDIIVARLKIAIDQPLTEDEREGLRRRERELDRIADGKDVVDAPDEPIDPPLEGTGKTGSWGSATKIPMRTEASE